MKGLGVSVSRVCSEGQCGVRGAPRPTSTRPGQRDVNQGSQPQEACQRQENASLEHAAMRAGASTVGELCGGRGACGF
jgi:hypothetical protein